MHWIPGRPNAARIVIVYTMTLLSACTDRAPTAPREEAIGGAPSYVPGPAPGPAAAYDATVPLAWYRLSFALTQEEGLVPPVAARAFGYAGVALWEAVVPGVPGGRSLAGQLNGLGGLPTLDRDVYWPAAANAALAATMSRFYTTARSRRAIRALEHDIQQQLRAGTPNGLLERSVAQGRRMAAAIWQWSRSDGYAEFSDCPYTPPIGAGQWTPTPPALESPVEPCWGSLRPFVLSSAGTCAPATHPTYSEDPNSEFYGAALEVYETVNQLSDEERIIAGFWADLPGQSGTPAGHSLSITAQALEQVDASLALAAEAFARVGIGESDAFISCWASKYHYNLLRPVTYINRLIDPDWASMLDTPPFPAYTSGHSNDAGASSTILTELFGEGFAFTDHTNDQFGFAPRSFGSFGEAANESAFSRLFGGIHYRFDIEEGLNQGRCVGRAVNALIFRTGLVPGA